MHDRVADVLTQRAALDRGAGVAVIASIAFHVALGGAAVYSALHARAPEPARFVSIRMMPAMQAPSAPRRAEARPTLPKLEAPKPVIEEPKPVVEKTPPNPPEKNTVPLSPFGKSTKKGSEAPPLQPPTDNRQPPTSTAPEIAIGGSGVTGLEGGDFPYALYIQGMHRKIGSNWFRPQVTGAATVIIYYRILRDGTITDAKVETPSGNSTFDRAALSAVRSASPLNPLPFAYAGNYLGVHLTFR
ncbi:MAG TPA: TonB family protein [Thermoanaerobaculia bacterium]|nr:TonB family protein [Thermoanaerobaculia bacterium]